VLKREIAARYARKGDEWPYRAEVLERIKLARESGQPVWLVTGAAESTARTIADHLGLFDRVLHSSDTENLTSRRKRERLVSLCGDGGFDYAGNSRDDLAVFDAARRAIIVAPDRAASRWGNSNEAELLPLEKISPLAILKSIRVHQWLKNILIAVPLVLNHEFADFDLLLAAIAAFFSFSFLASAVYIVNDISDLANDRQHPRKRLRPLAAGAVSIPVVSVTAAALLLASIGLASLLPPMFWGVLVALRPGDHGLHLCAQAQAAGRRVHACSTLHAADPGRCGRDRHRAVILASCLFDLLLSEPCPGQALCRARRTCSQ
jgi:diacylglycerol kinase